MLVRFYVDRLERDIKDESQEEKQMIPEQTKKKIFFLVMPITEREKNTSWRAEGRQATVEEEIGNRFGPR